jgi:hypothetical protein
MPRPMAKNAMGVSTTAASAMRQSTAKSQSETTNQVTSAPAPSGRPCAIAVSNRSGSSMISAFASPALRRDSRPSGKRANLSATARRSVWIMRKAVRCAPATEIAAPGVRMGPMEKPEIGQLQQPADERVGEWQAVIERRQIAGRKMHGRQKKADKQDGGPELPPSGFYAGRGHGSCSCA